MLAPTPNQLVVKRDGFKPAGRVKIASRVTMTRRSPVNCTINRYKGGLRYERATISHLKSTLENTGTLLVEPCFRFSNGHRSRFCFPDALLLLPALSFDLLIEIKTRHTYDAWHQLRRLYEPVVTKATGREVKLLEIVKNYDPAIALPEEEVKVLNSLEDAIGSNAPYNIYIFTGRR